MLGRGVQGGRGVGGVCAELVLEGFLALHPHHVALMHKEVEFLDLESEADG